MTPIREDLHLISPEAHHKRRSRCPASVLVTLTTNSPLSSIRPDWWHGLLYVSSKTYVAPPLIIHIFSGDCMSYRWDCQKTVLWVCQCRPHHRHWAGAPPGARPGAGGPALPCGSGWLCSPLHCRASVAAQVWAAPSECSLYSCEDLQKFFSFPSTFFVLSFRTQYIFKFALQILAVFSLQILLSIILTRFNLLLSSSLN